VARSPAVSVSIHPVVDLGSLLSLEQVKPGAFLGAGPVLGWGRIYGGQVVAQALRAACMTVDSPQQPHSLHAYFVRAGNEHQPVLYEVERVRDGRTFSTRQVVAYQAGGAILNLIASFHAAEDGPDVQDVRVPEAVPAPDDVAAEPTDLFLDRRIALRSDAHEPYALGWIRVTDDLGDDPVLHACALAYLSDEFILGAALLPHPDAPDWDRLFTASLDHALWFHRPVRADDWLLFELHGAGVADARGLAFARVFSGGVHVASVAQEALGRARTGQ
jgi:acyl-CoA thioesterase II